MIHRPVAVCSTAFGANVHRSSQRQRARSLTRAAQLLVLIASSGTPLAAAHADVEAYAGTGRWLTKPTAFGADTYRWRNPRPTDVVAWTATASADVVSAPAPLGITEPKFNFAAGAPAARTMVGYNIVAVGVPPFAAAGVTTTGDCDGPASTVTCSAQGFGSLVGRNWTCACRLDVVGVTGLCTGAPGAPPFGSEQWDGLMKCIDPFTWYPDDFDHIPPGSTMDVFIPIAIEEGDVSANGEIQLHSAYQTASGRVDLLDLRMSRSGVIPTPGPSNVRYFLVNSYDPDPPANDAPGVPLSQIAGQLASSLADGHLDAPVYIGVLVTGVAVPTVDMGGGIVAKQIFDWQVQDFEESAGAPGACCCGSSCTDVADAALCNSPGGGLAVTFVPGGNCNPFSVVTPCCRADFNRNGFVSPQDIFEYLSAFFSPTAAIKQCADLNGSPPAAGGVSPQDIFDFVAAFFRPGGCFH